MSLSESDVVEELKDLHELACDYHCSSISVYSFRKKIGNIKNGFHSVVKKLKEKTVLNRTQVAQITGLICDVMEEGEFCFGDSIKCKICPLNNAESEVIDSTKALIEDMIEKNK